VVAYRSPQVRPARQAWDDHNGNARAATKGRYRFEKYEPYRTQQGTLNALNGLNDYAASPRAAGTPRCRIVAGRAGRIL